jgi:1,4-dihydroxy-2-naphthoate polyprenyltransferase
MTYISDLIKLSRPKFLLYTVSTHIIGAIEAYKQTGNFSWTIFFLLQFTISITHLMTHFFNEYGDYEVDKLNKKNSAWTGGSKMLKNGAIKKETSLLMGLLFTMFSLVGGLTVMIYYYIYINRSIPYDFFLFGMSVLFLSIAYSVKPFQLSYHALGEVIVSYVITFATPVVGCIVQNGYIGMDLIKILIPLFINNFTRMLVMNLPDKDGDKKGNKNTSVVLLGEEKTIILTNIFYLINYVYIIPNLDIHIYIKLGYLFVLPLRWWQSLRLNQDNWWNIEASYNSIPYVESMTVLLTALFISMGSYLSVVN